MKKAPPGAAGDVMAVVTSLMRAQAIVQAPVDDFCARSS
jgi:hypothetical protein